MLSSDTEIYQQNIGSQFSAICSDCGDLVATKPLLTDILNRQEILFMQYEIQKRGKNLGMAQNRLLKIDQGKLYQVDNNGQEKLLPNPIDLMMVKRGRERWEARYDHCKAMIILKFQDRSDITVFFKEIIEWREIGMYIRADIQKRNGLKFDAFVDKFGVRIAEELGGRISKMKVESADIKKLRVKAKLNDIFRFKLSDKAFIKSMMAEWKSRALFEHRPISLRIGLVSLRSSSPLTGVIKFWAKGMAIKQLPISSQQISRNEANNCQYSFKGQFGQEFIDISTEDEFQFEIECLKFTLKSERFIGLDLTQLAHRTRVIELNMFSKQETALLTLSLQVSGIEPYYQSQEITPQHYRVIDELYVPENLHFDLQNIHHFYSTALQTARVNRPYYVSFNRLRQLFELLKIEDLIQKFYLISPFKDFVEVECKGSVVYDYFGSEYERDLYYDVEKIIWQHQKPQYRRILSALKSLDSNQKFNFTDPLLFLVEKMQELAENETVSRWRSTLFSKDTKGIEAVAFFLSLAVIKSFSSIFFYQQFPNKRALPLNSFLFLYVLQKQLPHIFSKYLKIQLNIESFFGQNMVNLFSNLFEGDTFTKFLLLLLDQQQKDPQNLYYSPLVSVFLTVIEMVDKHKCAYLSAEHYLITFQQVSKNIADKLYFFEEVAEWESKVLQQKNSKQFLQLSEELTQFYLNNAYSGDYGEISRQIYQQFMCYHYKNELDLRKIFIVIDKIELWQRTPEINLTIFQSALKIYEHNFKGVDLGKLDHFIQLKLTKLQQLNLICNNGKFSFSCRLDPREMPSNLYFHLVKPLILTYHMSPECSRHIFMQVYIKDSCEIQSLENPVPNRYREVLLEEGLNKEDALFCKKFTKSFRMPENNFNLLYSKLGWFNCHYLVPDDRLISVQFLGPKQAGGEDLHLRTARLNKYTRSLFGKAILPYPTNEDRLLTIDIIKENVLTSYEPHRVSSQFTEMNVYSSASRLLCYCLDNFSMPTSMSFLQFYQQMGEKLPLIHYLSYQPKQFYYLPSFTFQVYCPTSTATVLISEKGAPFVLSFSPDQVKKIEEEAGLANKLPLEMEFGYVDQKMYFDQFLYLLRLNILKKAGLSGEKRGKAKRWPNSLISSTVSIPNYELRCFYEVMSETKQILQFQFKQTSNKVAEPPKYLQWALIKDRWRKVHCLAELKTSNSTYYYVIENYERRRHIIEERRLIKVSEQPFRSIVLSDDIADSMEVISYELTKMFNY